MSQPQRVIYLPPGVVAPQGPSGPPVAVTPGVPFDRVFFERILPPAVEAFCAQANCNVPIVEVITVDGARHYVNGISGVADQWVALQTTNPDHPHSTQVFVPYQTIFRVEIHPEADERRRHLGFVAETPPTAFPEIEQVAALKPGSARKKKPR